VDVLTVTVKDLGDVVTLFCKGTIVSGAEVAILCAAVRQYGRDLVLDLGEVDGIDAAGVGALIALQSAGVYFKLKNLARRVRETLRVRGVESIFEICDDPEGSILGTLQPALGVP
jgi:anti-anti-sigma regulatory factor